MAQPPPALVSPSCTLPPLRQALGWWGISLLILVLGAHFFRASAYGLTVCCAGVLALHAGRARWKGYAVSFFLCWGAFEWLATGWFLAEMRQQAGLPWVRAAAILLVVAFVTCLGAIALYRQHEARIQPDPDPHARLKGLVCIATFCSIHYLAEASPVPILLLQRFFPLWGAAEIALLALYSVWVLGMLLDPQRSRAGRKTVWLIFSLVFFGQLALGLLGITPMLMTGTLHIPLPAFVVFGPVFRESSIIMAVLVVVASLLVGSAWCSMLCYFGALDLCAAGNKAVKPIPPALQWLLRYGRACVLVVGVSLAFWLRFLDASMPLVLGLSLAFMCTSLIIMLMVSRRYASMIHCTTFCPLGFVVTMLAQCSPWRMRVDSKKCTHCRACEAVCNYRAISTASRTMGKTHFQCSLCRDCIPACKQGALRVQCVPIPWNTQHHTSIFIAIVTIVHGIFLAFARV